MNIQSLPQKKQYAEKWRSVVGVAQQTPHRSIYGLQWYMQSAVEVRREYLRALHARINKRGGVVVAQERATDHARIRMELEKRYTSSCKWCGAEIPYKYQQSQRFCSLECRCDYYS